jgi:eukaryotic-like serine/threonine-protein kinase
MEGEASASMIVEPRYELPRGTLLGGRYRILGPRARGGMGQVYVARHEHRPGRFALKVLGSGSAEDPAAVARLTREAEMLALVQHPNVVGFVEVDAQVVPAFLAMEFLEGQDLAEHIEHRGPAPPTRVAVIAAQVAAALEAVHALGIVHGDVKPGNIMLVRACCEQAKLLDFGLAHLVGSNEISGLPGDSSTIGIPGTPAFMAPEQVEGLDAEIDGRADQFALAVLCHVLLTGEGPFPGTHTF